MDLTTKADHYSFRIVLSKEVQKDCVGLYKRLYSMVGKVRTLSFWRQVNPACRNNRKKWIAISITHDLYYEVAISQY